MGASQRRQATKTATKVTVTSYLEEDDQQLANDQRGDERQIECFIPLGTRTVKVTIAEMDAAHTLVTISARNSVVDS